MFVEANDVEDLSPRASHLKVVESVGNNVALYMTLTRKLCFKMLWSRSADSSGCVYIFALNLFKGALTEGECKTLKAKVATRLLEFFFRCAYLAFLLSILA